DAAPPASCQLSLHDALPISSRAGSCEGYRVRPGTRRDRRTAAKALARRVACVRSLARSRALCVRSSFSTAHCVARGRGRVLETILPTPPVERLACDAELRGDARLVAIVPAEGVGDRAPLGFLDDRRKLDSAKTVAEVAVAQVRQ